MFYLYNFNKYNINMNISLETAICKTFKKLLQQRFGNTIFNDIYYDFESHEILFYDNLRNISKKAPELIETLKSIDKTIINWIIEEYGYKKVLHDIQLELEEDAIKTLIVFKLTEQQEESLIGYARILEGSGELLND